MNTIEKLANNYQVKLEKVMYNVIECKPISRKFKTFMLEDVVDHLTICDLVLAGKVKKAANLLEDLDTNSREDFPTALYNRLMGKL